MYVAIHIRLDITFAIERLSQYFSNLIKHYNVALKTLLRYLRFIIDKELIFTSNESSYLIAYLNLNYVINKLDRKFILKYVFMMIEESIS